MMRAYDQIGPYTLIRQIGRGSYGVVWLAQRRGALATTEVAVKLALDEDPDLSAIIQESQLWARLAGHPNILPIIEAEVYDDQIVIVSEYAPDGSLEDWLRRNGGAAATVEQAIMMTSGILAGLEHLHSKQVIHRDLKPGNILLTGETPRLADFGLARVLKASAHSGGIAGTPWYMSPEVFDGKRSELSDIWAAGVILHQMLTGDLPYAQSDLGALIGAIMLKPPQPLPNTLPEALRNVVEKSLCKEIAQRYQSATEMRADLQACHSNSISLIIAAGGQSIDNAIQAGNNALQPGQTLPTIPAPSSFFIQVLKPILQAYEYESVKIDRAGKVMERSRGIASYFLEDLNGDKLEMVSIPAGSFLMGSPTSEKSRASDEGPQHSVNVSEFYIGKYPITQLQWRVVADLPCIDRELNRSPGYFLGDDLPVEQISWLDAQEFCARLASRTGKEYRLPTEAEWEYACRAGSVTPFAFGETITPEIVNYNGNSPYGLAPKGNNQDETVPVGILGVANQFGLYDMHGNVWEWCLDIYHGNYQGAPADASSWQARDGNLRVLRGGSWRDLAAFCRSAYRNRNLPVYRNLNLGFRVALSKF